VAPGWGRRSVCAEQDVARVVVINKGRKDDGRQYDGIRDHSEWQLSVR
jgi:hypothetical protein